MGWAKRNRNKISPEMKRKILGETINIIYDKIPKVKCQGHCHPFCSAIAMEPIEKELIEEKHGSFPDGYEFLDGGVRCGSLTSDNKCSIYDKRPLICRLYGATKTMMSCPLNCEVEGEQLDVEEVNRLFIEMKFLNLEYYFPKRAEELMSLVNSGKGVDLEKYCGVHLFNVPEELWRDDMTEKSEHRKIRKTLESKAGRKLTEKDFELHQFKKKIKIYSEIKNILDNPNVSGNQQINLFNLDGWKKDRGDKPQKIDDIQSFFKSDLIKLSVPELWKLLFDEDIKDINQEVSGI